MPKQLTHDWLEEENTPDEVAERMRKEYPEHLAELRRCGILFRLEDVRSGISKAGTALDDLAIHLGSHSTHDAWIAKWQKQLAIFYSEVRHEFAQEIDATMTEEDKLIREAEQIDPMFAKTRKMMENFGFQLGGLSITRFMDTEGEESEAATTD